MRGREGADLFLFAILLHVFMFHHFNIGWLFNEIIIIVFYVFLLIGFNFLCIFNLFFISYLFRFIFV